jgi:pimeloyl-ACP methyl ester carboxylesterase
MKRLLLALALVLAFVPAAPSAAAERIDQAGWAAAKKEVTLRSGIHLAYAELGNPTGRPLLLLHGYTDTSRAWTILAPFLKDHRLLIPDQRGHGASDAPACCYTIADYAEDARLFLDAMGVERAAVAGHSMGSMVAQVLAAEHPERVTRIALIGSTALVPITRDSWMWKEIMALKQPIASNTAFLRQWSLAASPTPVDAELVRHADPETAATRPHVWRSVLRELLDVPAGRFASEVKAPVLILSGGKDELFPAEHHRALVAAYPGAEEKVFPGLGHNLVVEQPDAVGPVLARFMANP